MAARNSRTTSSGSYVPERLIWSNGPLNEYETAIVPPLARRPVISGCDSPLPSSAVHCDPGGIGTLFGGGPARDQMHRRLRGLVEEQEPRPVLPRPQLHPNGTVRVHQPEHHFPARFDVETGAHHTPVVHQLQGAGAQGRQRTRTP